MVWYFSSIFVQVTSPRMQFMVHFSLVSFGYEKLVVSYFYIYYALKYENFLSRGTVPAVVRIVCNGVLLEAARMLTISTNYKNGGENKI